MVQNFLALFLPITLIGIVFAVIFAIKDRKQAQRRKRMQMLVEGVVEAGSRSVMWEAKDVASGIYLVRMGG